MDLQKTEWDKAYDKKQNYLFYPHEEVIRFVSKYFRRCVGPSQYDDVISFQPAPRSLDLGCGIGRHQIYLGSVGFDSYGIDISGQAIQAARDWASKEGQPSPEKNIVEGSVGKLPWEDNYFQCVVSHGVLDSMSFEIAKQAVMELDRVVATKGLAYIDVISGDESDQFKEYRGEVILDRNHEEGTVQSYFNAEKIHDMLKDTSFTVREAFLIRRERIDAPGYKSRYHLVLERQ